MERRAIDIRGVVQGVGFRPFVHGLATRLNLCGHVVNRGGRVEIEVEGDRDALDRFERELTASAPPLARIESAVARRVESRGGAGFRIAPSLGDASPTVHIAPDAATCDACLAEMLDPTNRRYRYPFINCTACGPRLTIITGSPYDRERTTMARFDLCARCRAEYENPADRRFHAEPIACPQCGPRLEAIDTAGRVVEGDPIDSAAAALRAGRVVAIKGLGGFHLACDASDASAVESLRARKHRDDKPFAVMVADVVAAASLCEVSAEEAQLLRSTARPIVLLQKRVAAGPPEGGHYVRGADGAPDDGHDVRGADGAPDDGHDVRGADGAPDDGHDVRGADGPPDDGHDVRRADGAPDDGHDVRGAAGAPDDGHDVRGAAGAPDGGRYRPVSKGPHRIASAVAPDSSRLGVMLAYTPVHHLLLSAVGDRALVMTSGNRSDEPIAIANDEALSRLAGIADLFLLHDRDIRIRCEDSVVRHVGTAPLIVRRSRGYAPAPVRLAFDCREPILAVGGQLKNTFALGRGRDAIVSHHAGDLDELLAFDAFERDIGLYERTFEVTPTVIAHDLHPDYAATRFALSRGGVRHVGVQHHHAHVASCMAEHGLDGPVIGVAWDGAGWGPDGCVWGGEFLVGDRTEVHRAAHFRYVALPGGDRAAREPWRMALSHLHDAGIDEADALRGVPVTTRRAVGQMIERGLNAPMTSSVGRLFDAVAALCGAAGPITFEGQAAMWLESLAEKSDDPGRYPFGLDEAAGPAARLAVDTRPLIQAIEADRRAGVAPAELARRFHTTLTIIVTEVARLLRARTGLGRVALSGGVFLNGILTAEIETLLAADGFAVYRHRVVSPGDGGLSLGQLAVAAASVAAPKERSRVLGNTGQGR